MKKIEFINDSAPYLSAENLNLLQDNVEEGIEESKLEEYSTSEQRIGTWIDGKPLYRVAGEVDFNNDLTILENTSTYDFKKVLGWVIGSNGFGNQLPYRTTEDNRATIFTQNDKSRIGISARGSGHLVYIFEYTKTTD